MTDTKSPTSEDQQERYKKESLFSQRFAFPFSIGEGSGKTITHYGMPLRDWFAGQALQGILAGYWGNDCMSGLSPSDLAESAYQYADAMMEKSK